MTVGLKREYVRDYRGRPRAEAGWQRAAQRQDQAVGDGRRAGRGDVADDVVTPPTTKEGQRAELHKTIWRLANELRGSVDGWDFKSYVLAILSTASFRRTSPPI